MSKKEVKLSRGKLDAKWLKSFASSLIDATEKDRARESEQVTLFESHAKLIAKKYSLPALEKVDGAYKTGKKNSVVHKRTVKYAAAMADLLPCLYWLERESGPFVDKLEKGMTVTTADGPKSFAKGERGPVPVNQIPDWVAKQKKLSAKDKAKYLACFDRYNALKTAGSAFRSRLNSLVKSGDTDHLASAKHALDSALSDGDLTYAKVMKMIADIFAEHGKSIAIDANGKYIVAELEEE